MPHSPLYFGRPEFGLWGVGGFRSRIGRAAPVDLGATMTADRHQFNCVNRINTSAPRRGDPVGATYSRRNVRICCGN